MPKSGAERTRAWREKKRASEGTDHTKKRKKSRTEIVRDSRERRKMRESLLRASSVGSISNELNTLSASTLNQPHFGSHVRDSERLQYPDYNKFKTAHNIFNRDFVDNAFGSKCCVCDRLWFKNDLKPLSIENEERIQQKFPEFSSNNGMACTSCRQALRRNNIPTYSTLNGFVYPSIPAHLPKLDLVSERLISPRIPFMQIRRLCHVHGQFGILGQVINVPFNTNTMVHQLPRSFDDDHCINVHIKSKKLYRSSYLRGLVNKRNIKEWLRCLISSPLYQLYDIKLDESFFDEGTAGDSVPIDELSEDILMGESLITQQNTLVWNYDKYLSIAPGEMNLPHSLLFDGLAEEISFPTIYLGQFRKFSEELNVTPFMMAISELRRSDRRGVTPHHLLYMAMKIMRLKVLDSLIIASKHVSKDTKMTREQIQSEEYINQCMESNLAFLSCIPNSTWYWAERKRDLLAMIRQLGKPNFFLTMSANEIGWPSLLQLLYKLKSSGIEISKEAAKDLHYIEKSTLINEDAVTCAIYFNKLINVIMNILQSKKSSPFGKYRVAHFFKRIEFQHHGSPQAHIFLWLDNAPLDPLCTDRLKAIEMIDTLMSVANCEASGNIKLQTHKHTFTCDKNPAADAYQNCRFETPFMPCRYTTILTPMQKEDPRFSTYKEHFIMIKNNLENKDYADIDSFYQLNRIISDNYYMTVLRAGINRPTVFIKRQPMEKWHNPFNPFIFNNLKSSMNIQFITEEYSCAEYLMEYVNKSKVGVSNLQRNITEIMNEHPDFDVVGITRKLSIEMLNSVEITSQEAAWYLLREPISKSSSVVVYIPTIWPTERQKIRKTQKELDEMGDGDVATNALKEIWFENYEKRPEQLEAVNLAQFVAHYTHCADGNWTRRKEPRIIRYRNYDMTDEVDEYKREMVTLYIPFRVEETEILAESRFLQIYDDNELLILERHKEFSSNLDILKMNEICRQLSRKGGENHDEDTKEDKVSRKFSEVQTMNDGILLSPLNIKSESPDPPNEHTHDTPTPPLPTSSTQNSAGMRPKKESYEDKALHESIDANLLLNANHFPIYKCSKCPFLSLKETERNNHVAMQHERETTPDVSKRAQINCPGCSNIFFTPQSLDIHLRLDHIMSGDDAVKLLNSINYILENSLHANVHPVGINIKSEQLDDLALVTDQETPLRNLTDDGKDNFNVNIPTHPIQEHQGPLYLRTVEELNLLNKDEVQHLVAPKLNTNHNGELSPEDDQTQCINIGDTLYEMESSKYQDLGSQMVNGWPETDIDLDEDKRGILTEVTTEKIRDSSGCTSEDTY